ncbi:MAG: ATP-binding protein [candidate division WOR-3 bacterium]|nr:ATP-binding protein [candidate division WOR-3 bacterium]MDH5683152.1 ATP-binding protein [candidate division WOR-3 bacterium]
MSDTTATCVSHPVFGEGEVLDYRWRRTEVLVKFKSGLRLWIPVSRVMPVAHEEKPISEISARRMIEAFRMGIVPHQDVEDFTFGRDSEIEKILSGLNNLKQGKGGVFLIEGEYGSGKTHLLEYIHHQALKMNMVTTRCEFDPREVAPNRPKRVWREIVHNLRFINQDHENSFRDLLRKASELSIPEHCFYTPLLAKLKRLDESNLMAEVFWQWIEGESTKEYAVEYRSPYRIRGGYRIPALYDFSTAADFYCYNISGLSYIAQKLELHGLVVLIDEAETVTHLWDIIAFTRGMNFLEGLIRTALDDPELKKIDSRLIHNQVRPTPYIYQDSYILLVIATTPMPYDYTYIKLTNFIKHRLSLVQLKEKALIEAFNRLTLVYSRAYPGFILNDSEKKQFFVNALKKKDEGIRFFIKYCVEVLDLIRLRQLGVIKKISN